MRLCGITNVFFYYYRADKIPSNLYSTYMQACRAMKEKMLQGKKIEHLLMDQLEDKLIFPLVPFLIESF